jgi:7,8-dihydropterin-6-yl-methyl-4-(beta-D-ribofuranosyl)aminobenzene 5'-phosphate synthase
MKEAGNVTITILADNTATPPYRTEHGFSALVETQEQGKSKSVILFDTGMGAIFGNADVAGVDLASVSDVVLSHGHYDHTDALGAFLEKHPAVRVHASCGILRDHYSLRTGACRRIALSDGNRVMLSALPQGQFYTCEKIASIPGCRIYLAGRIPRENPLETPSPLLFEDSACTIPDEVSDEIVLWTDTFDGLMILTGCCHAGFINTCEYIRKISGISKINTVIGGFHLANVSEKRMTATVDYIARTGIRRVIPCHCTGEAEIECLNGKLGPVVTKGECGMKIRFLSGISKV